MIKIKILNDYSQKGLTGYSILLYSHDPISLATSQIKINCLSYHESNNFVEYIKLASSLCAVI